MSQIPPVQYDVTDILGTLPYFPNGFVVGSAASSSAIYVTDGTLTTPGPIGALLTNTTGTWSESTVSGAALPSGAFGIVKTAAPSVGGQASIVSRGIVNALCTTGSVAITGGSPLVADGLGGLTTPSPSAAPSSATATAQVTGAATVTYLAYARNAYGLDSIASAAITTTTGPTTISAASPIVVSGTVPVGTTSVIIVRSVGGATQGVIGASSVAPGQTKFNFLDVGVPSTSATYTPNATATIGAGLLGIAIGTLAANTATETLVSVNLGGF